ncbi:BatC protein [Streptomyces sp. NBC_01310]|uniref:BatC protein n=1 Tax=Streptomyces sp. NBC_01310 TaxID=2903820 RepID=UPI0035B57130|nr:BatC protein [Streptomyces sp. NBC_01310]
MTPPRTADGLAEGGAAPDAFGGTGADGVVELPGGDDSTGDTDASAPGVGVGLAGPGDGGAGDVGGGEDGPGAVILGGVAGGTGAGSGSGAISR